MLKTASDAQTPSQLLVFRVDCIHRIAPHDTEISFHSYDWLKCLLVNPDGMNRCTLPALTFALFCPFFRVRAFARKIISRCC